MPGNSERRFMFGKVHTLLTNITIKPIEQILPLLTLFLSTHVVKCIFYVYARKVSILIMELYLYYVLKSL
jgi:hypothetical protein